MEVTKTIVMTSELAASIQELAARERRSFAREAQVLLEEGLKRLGMGPDRPPATVAAADGGGAA
jgi:hypothetical protein